MVCPTSIFKVNFSHVQVIDYQSFEDDIESISDYSVVPLMLYNLASLEDEAGLIRILRIVPIRRLRYV